MSKDIKESINTISALITKELTIADGVGKIGKDVVFATLPDGLSKEDFVKSVSHLRDFDAGFKLAAATQARSYFAKNTDVDQVSAHAVFDHHKFTARVSREHTVRNPTTGAETQVKGYTSGGFRLAIPSSHRNHLKAQISELYADA